MAAGALHQIGVRARDPRLGDHEAHRHLALELVGRTYHGALGDVGVSGHDLLGSSVSAGLATVITFPAGLARLARSGREWHQLLELCALSGALLGDQDIQGTVQLLLAAAVSADAATLDRLRAIGLKAEAAMLGSGATQTGSSMQPSPGSRAMVGEICRLPRSPMRPDSGPRRREEREEIELLQRQLQLAALLEGAVPERDRKSVV